MLERIKRVIGPAVGVFVGGDTDWKLATMAFWAKLAHAAGAICHIGRVNTLNRVRLCELAEADSFDGSSASRYAVNVAPLDRARRVQDLFTLRRAA